MAVEAGKQASVCLVDLLLGLMRGANYLLRIASDRLC